MEEIEGKFQSIAKPLFPPFFSKKNTMTALTFSLTFTSEISGAKTVGQLWEFQQAHCGLKSTDKGAWLPSLACCPTHGEQSSQAKVAAAMWEPSSAAINYPEAGRSSESQRFQLPTSSFLFLFFS